MMRTVFNNLVVCLLTVAMYGNGLSQFSKVRVMVKGMVTDAESGQPVRARMSFMDGAGKEVNKVYSNSEGKYSAVLAPGSTYTLRASSSQRYVSTMSVSVPASEKYMETTQDVALKPIHSGRVMFSDACFDYGSVSPRATAASAIAEVGKGMALNNEIEVTLETFCDDAIDETPVIADQGTQRAESLRKILTANGAPANRIVLKTHNPPPPPPPPPDSPAGKGKKKAKVVKKVPPKKAARGKKNAAPATPPAAKASITITSVHSEDD